MATLIKTLFPAGAPQDVCNIQSTLGASNLVLNGTLNTSGIVSFTALGYSRQLSFTSTNNLSGVTFTIYGTQNGVSYPTLETVTGPNNTTVYSTKVYDVINAISVSGAVTGIAVGTGYLGFFNLITIAENLNDTNYTLSLGATIGSNQIPTTIFSTLDNIASNGSPFSTIISNNVGTLSTIATNAAMNLYILPNYPTVTSVPFINQLLIQLIGTTSTIGNGVTLIFRQTT